MAHLYARAVRCALAFATLPVLAQQTVVAPNPSPNWKLPSFKAPGCALASKPIPNLRDRACFETNRLLSTGGLLHGFEQSAFTQWIASPHDFYQGKDQLSRHLEEFYVRRSAASAGELLAGWLNHEPLQYSPSGKTGFWTRSRAALSSVAVVHDDTGVRPAFAPLAASLASGFVTLGCCGRRTDMPDALRRSSFTYAGYFATALFREYKPELKAYWKRRFRKQ